MANRGTENRTQRSAVWFVAVTAGLTLAVLAAAPARAQSVPVAPINWKSEAAISGFRSMGDDVDCTAPDYARLRAADDVAAMVAAVEGKAAPAKAASATVTVVATK